MNALKHGFYSAAQNHQLAMLALGEDPKEFQVLQENLLTTYGPGDELWCRQIEDLAKLYWRRSRLERMQTGVMRRALQEVEEKQHGREQELDNATFDPTHPEILEFALAEPSDDGVRLRRILSTLGVIRALVDSLLKFKTFFFLKGVQGNALSFLRSGADGSTEHLLSRH